ncbi:MAG: EF-Tu/IF-2/RF-3 family GTPase, partial [Methanomassiliicoccales archaeon]
TNYPERLALLYYTCALADIALLVVDKIDAQFGESLLMLDALRKNRGYILLREGVVKEQLAPLIKGTAAEGYEYIEDDLVRLRDSLLDQAGAVSPTPGERAGGSVPIDHHFNVKGVGTVVLGFVARGEVKRHDLLRALPGKKEAQVRSIQKHDDDYENALPGDRVGLALKGIDSDELDRGFVLTNQTDMLVEGRVKAKVELIRFWPQPLREDMVVHLGHWMQFIAARIASIDNTDWRHPVVELVLDKEVVHPPSSPAVMMHLEGGKLRIVGSLVLP